MLMTRSSLIHSFSTLTIPEPEGEIEPAAKKSPLQVTEGIRSVIECVKA